MKKYVAPEMNKIKSAQVSVMDSSSILGNEAEATVGGELEF